MIPVTDFCALSVCVCDFFIFCFSKKATDNISLRMKQKMKRERSKQYEKNNHGVHDESTGKIVLCFTVHFIDQLFNWYIKCSTT